MGDILTMPGAKGDGFQIYRRVEDLPPNAVRLRPPSMDYGLPLPIFTPELVVLGALVRLLDARVSKKTGRPISRALVRKIRLMGDRLAEDHPAHEAWLKAYNWACSTAGCRHD
jgi:hypothetical protein